MIENIFKSIEKLDVPKEVKNLENINDLKLENIDPFGDSNENLEEYSSINKNLESLDLENIDPLKDLDEPSENTERAQMIPRTGGEWTGEPGNSIWIPDMEKIPQKQTGINKDNQSWGELCKEYDIEGINFIDGEPDFSEISKVSVEIDEFTTDRSKNFYQANEKAAEKRGCSPDDVEDWMSENGYTWHERSDCKTMEKVPSKVHNFIPHSGGISKEKNK